MSSSSDNRVLNRKGAHELTSEETEQISGGRLITVATPTWTGPQNQDSDFDE